MILKLKDGGIEKIYTDNEYNRGSCPTCDYGSEYITNMIIHTTKYKIDICVISEIEFKLSTGDVMEIFLPNVDDIMKLTESDFIDWLEDELHKIAPHDSIGFAVIAKEDN